MYETQFKEIEKQDFMMKTLPSVMSFDRHRRAYHHSVYLYRGASLIRKRPPPRTTVGP